MLRLLSFSALVAASLASCPNDCSGHGACNVHSACECYRNWQGPDCSKRTCYFSTAFVDTPQGDLNADGRVSKANVYRVVFTSDTTVSGTTFGTLPAGTLIKIDNVATPCTTTCDTVASGWGTPSSVTAWAVTTTEVTAYANHANKYEIVTYVSTPNGFAPAVGGMTSSSPTGAKIYSAVRDQSAGSYSVMDINGVNDFTVTFAQISAATQPFVYNTQFSNKQTWEKYPTNHGHAMGASGQKRFYDEAHFYAECSGKGVCNRDSGECECFDGYTGSGCAQLACPNDCSGHGVCKRLAEQNSNYRAWDRFKTTTCVCDPGYTNVDCSDRICPSGDDPITRGQVPTVLNFGHFHKLHGTTKSYFALEFTDEFGEKWTTSTIELSSATTALSVEDALQALPNSVVENVLVDKHTVADDFTHDGTNAYDNGDATWFAITFLSNTGDVPDLGVRYDLTFVDDSNTNGNNIKDSDTNGLFTTLTHCADSTATNCVYTDGSNGVAVQGTEEMIGAAFWTGKTVTDKFYFKPDPATPLFFMYRGRAGTTENTECSSRGLCDHSTGLCKCFNGFTDDDCSRQNALAMY